MEQKDINRRIQDLHPPEPTTKYDRTDELLMLYNRIEILLDQKDNLLSENQKLKDRIEMLEAHLR